MDRSRIAIVIPTLNESKTIANIVASVIDYGQVIVVDDGSSDNSGNLASEAGAEVVTHIKNLGYDKAINSGFAHASFLDCEIAITLDGDGQHDPSLIERFLYEMKDDVDLVIGIRSYQQRVAEYIFSYYSKYFFGINDPLCGMKAYRMKIYDLLGHFDSYESFGTELAFFGIKNGFRMCQVPFELNKRKDNSRFNKVIETNYKILIAMIRSASRIKKISHQTK
jgi:glycosyltransferase involved in cell wall biosynthesis